MYDANAAKNRSRWVNPQQACLDADYQYKGTYAEAAWVHTCEEFGSGVPHTSLAVVAAQTRQMIDRFGPISLLTGHSLGCEVALSEGLVLNMSVICFSVQGSFTAAWHTNYPGLDAAIERQSSRSMPGTFFVLQTYTDPYSNCLEPRPVDIVAVCSFPGPPPGCNGINVSYSYDCFSPCAQDAHWVSNILTVPPGFTANECSFTSQAYVAIGCANRASK